MIDPRTPILVGCGQITDTTSEPSSKRSRVAFCAEAAARALDDTGARIGGHMLGHHVDALAVMEFFSDISPRFASPFGRSTNPPKSVARRLHASPRKLLYSHSGGNMPQYLVNRFAEEIAAGETRLALICGAELLRSTQNARKAGLALDWNEDFGGTPERIGDNRFGYSEEEARHELRAAIHFYPLLENAIRGGLKRDVASHMDAMGRLFHRLAIVAKDNPLATRRKGYSAHDLSTISDDNRWICFPYPRLMNANAIIDQAAAVIMTSVEKAREWGIPEERWVFLHGCADGTDTWVVSERDRLDASPAIRGCARIAFDMAGRKLSDITAFDLYSCFPSAVEVAMAEIGIAGDDPRPISITGGLPFFGGPGNNYVTHSIAEMMNVVRKAPELLRHGDGQRQLPDQAFRRHLLEHACRGPLAPRGPGEVPGRARRAAQAEGEHGTPRDRDDRDLLRGLRQGCAGERLHFRPPRRLGRALRGDGAHRTHRLGRHADERATRA